MNNYFVNPEYMLFNYSGGVSFDYYLSNSSNEIVDDSFFENITAPSDLFSYFFNTDKFDKEQGQKK